MRAQLRSLEPGIGKALPTGLKADRFLRVVFTELSKSERLAQCVPATILGAVMTAAQLGLEFGPLGHAYLVPYKGRCTLIVGYKGYIDLARRSGQLRSIVARPVHVKDRFEFELGTDEHLKHLPSLDGDSGPVIAYYGIAKLQNGDPIITVMSPAEVEKYRLRSANTSDQSNPWITDFDAMACKTVIRRMVPWLPLSVEAAQAIESDEKVIEWTGESLQEATPTDDEPAEAASSDVIETTAGDAPAATQEGNPE